MDQADLSLPSWQRGQSLSTLRRLARPFLLRHKPLIFGAYGLVRERDVASAIERSTWYASGDGPEAAAIMRPVKAGRSFRDFRGEEIALRGPGYWIDSFAALDFDPGLRLLQQLILTARGHPIYAELFEEDEVAVSSFTARGFRLLGTKIAAGSEIKGVYGAPWGDDRLSEGDLALAGEEQAALEILDADFLLAEDQARIAAEIEVAGQRWAQHYSSYNKRRSWTSFALRGFSYDPQFIIKPAEMAKKWREAHPAEMAARPRWTDAAIAFPHTLSVIDRLLKRIGRYRPDLDRVRFMRLSGGGELTRHADITDREAGVADERLARLHIPISTNPAVEMRAWGLRGEECRIHFPERALCYLDQRKPHAVVNPARLDRVHIVLDVRGSDSLRSMIRGAHARH